MRLPTEVIALSREEFSRFVGFCNNKYGNHPIIIGGWAVDYYNPYYGSKDIDVVFEAKPDMYDRLLIHFFRTNGYERHSKDILGLETTFRKKVKTSNGVEFIDIDACSINDRNPFHKHKEKELPYKLLTKNLLQAETKGVSFTVPKLDLLFLYKLKAYADRDFETSEAGTIEDVQYFTSKRDKDGADLIALADTAVCKHRLDPDKVGSVGGKTDSYATQPFFSNYCGLPAYLPSSGYNFSCTQIGDNSIPWFASIFLTSRTALLE